MFCPDKRLVWVRAFFRPEIHAPVRITLFSCVYIVYIYPKSDHFFHLVEKESGGFSEGEQMNEKERSGGFSECEQMSEKQ